MQMAVHEIFELSAVDDLIEFGAAFGLLLINDGAHAYLSRIPFIPTIMHTTSKASIGRRMPVC